MGRLPKGFKKTLQHHADGPEQGEATPASAPSTSKEGKTSKTSKSNASSFLKDPPAPAPTVAAPAHLPAMQAEDGGSDEEGDTGPETKGKMIQRHKKEMQAFKKNVPRMGKKSKDEIAKMTADLETKHAKELAAFDASQASGLAGVGAGAGKSSAVEEAREAVADMQVSANEADGEAASAGGKHMTKAMKRRQKAAQEEAEREARIAAEAAAAGPSARQAEEEALVALLEPLGLQMREIRDQLTLAGGTLYEYQQLRTAAAAHMRKHPDEYSAFMDVDDDESPEEALERYCKDLESTAAWGGQLELSVLAHVLQRSIRVHTVGLSPITLGEEYTKEEKPPLQVCYLRHAFGLGEHYNSLGPAA